MTLPLRPGDVVDGKFRVEAVLGQGGIGIVYAATHVRLLRPVALKFLLPHALRDRALVERFLREARIAVSIHSQHVVNVLDAGEIENGEPYMAMELLRGIELGSLLESRGPLPIEDAVDYVLQTCEGLAEAHVRGVVHRDLKPANLFLTKGSDGSTILKVLDFGISKATQWLDRADLTPTASMMGTPLYVSPEQLRSTRRVDARADIWSLGVVIYQMLEGRTPFVGGTVAELFLMILQEPALPITRQDVTPELRTVIGRCLRKEPAERFANVAALAYALVPFGPPDAATQAARVARILGVVLPGGHPSDAPSSCDSERLGPAPQARLVTPGRANVGTMPEVGKGPGASPHTRGHTPSRTLSPASVSTSSARALFGTHRRTTSSLVAAMMASVLLAVFGLAMERQSGHSGERTNPLQFASALGSATSVAAPPTDTRSPAADAWSEDAQPEAPSISVSSPDAPEPTKAPSRKVPPTTRPATEVLRLPSAPPVRSAPPSGTTSHPPPSVESTASSRDENPFDIRWQSPK